MSQRVIQSSPKLAKAMKTRRQELGFTIEEAASKAGVGTKTWCRYEAGESIRRDKAKGICKALNWRVLPDTHAEDPDTFDLEAYKRHEAWSNDICDCFGEAPAICFAVGSDIILDCLDENLRELSRLPKGTHVGQLPVSMMKDILSPQFLVRYDYDFLYRFKMTVTNLRRAAHRSDHFYVRSVMEELAIYLFAEQSDFLLDCMTSEMESCHITGLDWLDDWVFALFDDMDIVTFLYSDIYYLTDNGAYHFDHWTEEQFSM